jgi:hypothetical protein
MFEIKGPSQQLLTQDSIWMNEQQVKHFIIPKKSKLIGIQKYWDANSLI